MEEQKKSRKPLLVGVIAAVVVLAALLALLLTQCVGGQGPDTTSGAETTVPTDSYVLYWNVNRDDFKPIDGESTTGRKPADDGFYHVVFAVDGKQVELRVKERRLVNVIDANDLMGLMFDENGDVIDVIRLDDMPVQRMMWQYYIQSFGGNAVKLNSSKDMDGMEELIKTNDKTGIYDVSGWSEFVGAPGKLQKEDRAYVIANMAGEITHIFLYERVGLEKSFRAQCKHCGEEVTWENWMRSDSLPVRTGHYFLENTVEANGQNAIEADAQICLDLNGQTVHSKSTARIYSTFNEGSSLAVMDNSDGEPGKFVSEGKNMDQGCCLWARYGSIDIYDITVDGSGATTHNGGTAVAVESRGKVTLHSGTLIGGKTVEVKDKTNTQAGATVRVIGKFVMESGLITGGSANKQGGCVWVSGKNAVFTMNGGKITNGRTNGMNGGNVAVMDNAEFVMNGGTISGGRGIKSKDKNSNGYGGNVYIYRAVFTMNGGTITDGRCYNNDGTRVENDKRQNIFNVDGELYMNGGKVTGYVNATDSNLTDNVSCLVSVTGSAKITGAKEGGYNLSLGNGIIFKAGRLSGKADVRVYASGIFSEETRESNVNYIHSDVPNADVVYYDGRLAIGRLQCLCSASLTEGKAHAAVCDQKILLFGAYTNSVSKAVSGNYYLTADLMNAGQLDIGTANKVGEDGAIIVADPITFNLDLNGYKIISKNRSILARPNATINITDSVGGGYIEGKGVTLPYTNACVLLTQRGSTVNVIGATLKGSETPIETMKTGGVIQSSGTVNLYDATIIGTKLPALKEDGSLDKSSGGAVYLSSSAVLNMYGNSSITGGETAGYQAHGGNVYAENKAQINMYDNSKIFGGKASPENKGGGGNVYLYTNAGLTLHDNASVVDGITDSTSQADSLDVMAVNGKIGVYGGHIGYVACTGSDGGNCEVLVGGNAKIDMLRRKTWNSTNAKKTTTELCIVQIEGKLSDDAKIVMYNGSGIFTNKTVAENADNFATKNGQTVWYVEEAEKLCIGEYVPVPELDDAPKALFHCICGMKHAESLTGTVTSKGECFGDCVGEIVEWSPWTGGTMPNKAGYWFMFDASINYKQGEFPKADAAVYIDLYGKTINTEGRAFQFNTAATASVQSLTIMDSVGGGAIVAPANVNNHSALMMSNKNGTTYAAVTFDLYGGHLDGSNAVYTGTTTTGAIRLRSNATINLFGGKISGQTVNADGEYKGYGGAIYLDAGSAVTMSGNAEIVGGTVSTAGGAVYMAANTSLTMKGNASITSGSAQENSAGGNVHAVTGADIKVADSAKVDDLKLNTGCYIEIEGVLTNDAKITVDTGSGIFTGKTVAENADNFTAKNGETVRFIEEAERLCIGEYIPAPDPGESAKTLFHCICGMKHAESLTGTVTSKGECFGDCEGTIVEWTPWTGETMPNQAGYWVMDAGTYSQGTFPKADVAVYIDLYGKTINTEGRAFQFNTATTASVQSLTVMDSVGGGAIVAPANVNNYSALMWSQKNGTAYAAVTFNLYSGHLDASNAVYTGAAGTSSQVGAIRLRSGATINLFGGRISGQSVNANSSIGGDGSAIYLDSNSTMTMEGSAQVVGGTISRNGGAVYMASNTSLTMSGNAEIVGGTTPAAGGAIYVVGGATLTVKDGAKVSGGTAAEGATIYALGTVNIENATINGGVMNRNGVVSGGLGGAIFAKNCSLTIKNSVINGGYADELSDGTGADSVAYGGGAIWADSATVLVENSQLIGYTEAHSNIRRGGVVYAVGNTEFTLKNSTITGAKVQAQAAAVMVSGTSTFTMTGENSVISANAEANPSLSCGGAVSVSSGSTLNIEDGTITGTKVQETDGGGAVAVYGTNAKLVMSGGKITGGESLENQETTWGGGVSVYDNATVELSGSAKIIDNIGGNLFLKDGSTITVGTMNVDNPETAEINEAAQIGISMQTPGVFSSNTVAATTGFIADVTGTEVRLTAEGKLELYDPNYVPPVNPDPDVPGPDVASDALFHCICGMKHAESLTGTVTSKGECFGVCVGEIVEWKPWTGTTMPNTAGYWYMTAENQPESGYTIGEFAAATSADVYIDLNGQTVCTSTSNRAFKFNTSTATTVQSLTIVDSVGNGSIVVDAGNNHSALMMNQAGGSNPGKAIFNLYGGHLDASQAAYTASSQVGAIRLRKNATVNMYGGRISGQLVNSNGAGTGSGGVIYLDTGSTMTMSGSAEIIGGTVASAGGAVYMAGSTFLTMSGNASITGGTVNGVSPESHCTGGAVFVSNGATLTLNETAHITGGTISTTYLSGKRVPYGGNVFAAGEVVLNGKSYITGGRNMCDTKDGRGGNVYIASTGKVTLNVESYISGGSCTDLNGITANGGQGGNVHVVENGQLYVNGSAYITGGSGSSAASYDVFNVGGTVKMNGGEIGYINSGLGTSKFHVQGNAKVGYIKLNAAGTYITIDGKLGEEADIKIASVKDTAGKIYASTVTMDDDAWLNLVGNPNAIKTHPTYLSGKVVQYRNDGIYVVSNTDGAGL